MTYDEAKKTILVRRVIGFPVAVAASISSVISVLKMFYVELDSVSQAERAMAQPFKNIIELIYRNTHSFIEYFWVYSPTPNVKALVTAGNLYFLAGYVLMFLALALIASSRKLSIVLAEVDRQISQELIRASVTGRASRQRHEVEESVPVIREGILSQFHKLYIAPIIATLVAAFIAKILGIV